MKVKILEGFVEAVWRDVSIFLLALVRDHDDAFWCLLLRAFHERAPGSGLRAEGLLEFILGVDHNILLEGIASAVHCDAQIQVNFEGQLKWRQFLHYFLEIYA